MAIVNPGGGRYSSPPYKGGNLAVPESIGDSPVVELGEGCFSKCFNLRGVILPESLKRIGDGAFAAAWIQKMFIPKSVRVIGDRVFDNCSNLRKIEVDENNEWYEGREGVLFTKGGAELVACPQDKWTEEYVLTEEVKRIRSGAFKGCKHVKRVDASRVEEMGTEVFKGCNGLQEVIFSGNLKEVPEFTFYSCVRMKEFVVPEGVERLGKFSFVNCTRLKKLVLPESLVEIGEGSFDGCEELVDIEGARDFAERFPQEFRFLPYMDRREKRGNRFSFIAGILKGV